MALMTGGLYASGFENTGLGTTARGLGGAFRAVANDWSAAYYNPAGYAFLADNQFGGALALFNLRNEITPQYVAVDDFGNEYGWGIANGQTLYNYHRVLNNPAGGLVARMPVWGETVFGFSIFQPFDYSIVWRLYAMEGSFMRAYNPRVIGSQEIPSDHYRNDLDVVAFQFSAAHEFMGEKLAVGAGLQLLRADLWYDDLTFRANPRSSPISDRPRDRIPEFTDNQGVGWGFGLRGGALYKLNDKIDLAITAYMPFDITVKGDTRFTFIMPQSDYVTVPSDSPDTLFVNGQIKTFTSDFETKLKLPASLALGIAVRPTERLTIALDAEYTLWSHYDGLAFEYSAFNGVGDVETAWHTQNLIEPVEWDNAGKVALGAMYDVGSVFTMLAGGSADQSPARDSREFTPQFMDLGTKYGFNVGGTFHINQWDLGIITSYFDYPDVDLRGLTDPNADDIFDNFPAQYKAATYETVVSFGYRF